MLVNGLVLNLALGYLAHQMEQFGVNMDFEKEKVTLDTRLKSLIKWAWLEGQGEAIVNGACDALAFLLKDEADMKKILVDLADQDFLGAVGVLSGLIASDYAPTTDEGKLVKELASQSFVEAVKAASAPLAPAAAPVEAVMSEDHVAHVAGHGES